MCSRKSPKDCVNGWLREVRERWTFQENRIAGELAHIVEVIIANILRSIHLHIDNGYADDKNNGCAITHTIVS